MCIQQATVELTGKIQQKKEELYNEMCKAEQSFWTSSYRNKRLLQVLSVQVKPRPEDSKWYDIKIYAVIYSLFLCCVDMIPFDLRAGTFCVVQNGLSMWWR
jgi:hypothetical protein